MIANKIAGMMPTLPMHALKALKKSSDLRGRNATGRSDGRDLFVTQRGGTGALADWTGSSEQLRRIQVEHTAWFAVHVMSAMGLAGLDRTYGPLSEEVDRILRASEDSPPSPNIVIDFALMRKIREANTSALQLEVDSASPRVADVGAQVLVATTEVLRSFLTSKKMPATPAFEVILGVTDPDDQLRALGKRIGETDRIVTASLATYLALTLCDPYAYGMSPTRSVHAFLASTIQRAKLRSEGKPDESDWELTDLDQQIMLAPEILNAGDDDVDSKTLSAALAAIEAMPAFKTYMACALHHRSTHAHRTNRDFHGMYTILKATYIVNVSVTWLQKVLMSQMELEETAVQDEPAARTPQYVKLTQDARHELGLHVNALEKIQERYFDDGLRDLSGAYFAIAVIADKIRSLSRTAVFSGTLLGFESVLIADRTRGTSPTSKHDSAIASGDPAQLTAAVASGVKLLYPAQLALPGERIKDAPPVSQRLAAEIVSGSSEKEILILATRLRQYAQLLLALASVSEQASAQPAQSECGAGCTEQRMYKLATPLLILGRTYAFLQKLFNATGAGAPKKIPVIVTMIRNAGWSEEDKVTKMRYTTTFARQFEAFTMAMGHGLLYCHEATSDSTRGLQFGMAMQKLRDANLTLMAMLQRRVLDTTTDCHPFRHGALTQLTLPAAAVARMLPSDRVLPLDWATAQKLHLDRDSTLRALIGNTTFTRLREEDSATLGLLRLLSKQQEGTTAAATGLTGASARLAHMKALAFSGRR
jgi:hypothetical protein